MVAIISNNSANQNFKATRVAQINTFVNNVPNNFEIYKLGSEDKNFLQNFAKTIKYNKLMPQLSKLMQKKWQNVFDYSVATAMRLYIKNLAYIAMQDNKLCGIISYTDNDTSFFLDGLCSIPQNNKKVPFVGQILFTQVFKDAIENNIDSLNLKAVTEGPYDVVKKYENLGFRTTDTSLFYTKMSCNKEQATKTFAELTQKFKYIKGDSKKVRLEDIFN